MGLLTGKKEIALSQASKRLGGFKVLKEVSGFSAVYPKDNYHHLGSLSRELAGKKINLPFFISESQGQTGGLQLVVETQKAEKISRALKTIMPRRSSENGRRTVLSLFPHKNDPHIAGALLQALGKAGVRFSALAHSQSAISVVLRESDLNRAVSALFDPFCFGAYRTPADWKLAQKGKEDLHKETVATYQEQRPKVYCLEWQNHLSLLQVVFQSSYEGAMGLVFEDLAEKGFHLNFLITSPEREEGEARMLFCVQENLQGIIPALTEKWLPDAHIIETPAVALFSMNGPHFGDRHGLVAELLGALDETGVQLLALSCSIASMAGVVPSNQIQTAILGIQSRFEVPSVIEK